MKVKQKAADCICKLRLFPLHLGIIGVFFSEFRPQGYDSEANDCPQSGNDGPRDDGGVPVKVLGQSGEQRPPRTWDT